MDKTIICPGCGRVGTVEMLGPWDACPECDYENGLESGLLTLSEMLDIEELLDLADRFLRAVGGRAFGDSARKGDVADG